MMKISRRGCAHIMKAEAVLCTYIIALLFGLSSSSFGPCEKWRKERRGLAVSYSCSCSIGIDGAVEIECHHNGTQEENSGLCRDQNNVIRAKFRSGRDAIIQCTSSTKWKDLGLIAGLDVGSCPSVTFSCCPLPTPNESTSEDSFREFFGSTGVQNVTSLVFHSHQNLTDKLLAKYLEGLNDLKKLDLSDNGFTTLPEDLFSDVPDVEWINLVGNNINVPSALFQKLGHLKVLEMGNNGITSLHPNVFHGLSRLRLLNLWQNKLWKSNLSRSHFRDLSSLESLDLHSNGLRMFSTDIFYDLTSLKNLNLESNNFTSLPHDFFIRNSRLEKLRLNYNLVPLRAFPSGLFANLTSLKELSVENCGLEWLPKDLLQGSISLLSISFSGNKLESIPFTLFSGLKYLEHIRLRENRLITLPETLFSGLNALKSLNLGKNQLQDLPAQLLYDLSYLKELDLSFNNLTDLDGNMFVQCKSLRKVVLSHNKLSFSKHIGGPELLSPLHYCINLEVLELSNNTLNVIYSDWLTTMIYLKELNLSNNLISDISMFDLQFISDNLNVNLENNNISSIDLRLAELWAKSQGNFSKKSVIVLLDNNPLNCNCDVYDLLRYVEGRMAPEVMQLFTLKTDNILCHSPENHSGKPLKSLNSHQLTCDSGLPQATTQDEEALQPLLDDAQEALRLVGMKCPTHCHCLSHPEDKSLIVNCSGSDFSALPLALPVVSEKNYTELVAEGLGLQSLWPPSSLPLGYGRVRVLRLGRNFLTNIDVHSLPPHLNVLEVHQNNLTHLSKDVVAALSHVSQITLHNNPWSCDCEMRDLLNFVQENFKQVELLSNVTCSSGYHSTESFSQLTLNDICPHPTGIIVAACTSLAVFGIALGVLAALYYHHRHAIKVWLFAHRFCLWLITEEELDKDKEYDAFISYSHKDEDFVVGELVPGLEGKSVCSENAPDLSGEVKKDIPTYKLCLHFRDWVAGDWIPDQIARSVDASCRTIVVLSPAFLESVWGKMEFRAAHCSALSEGRARVIVIIYGDIPPADSLDQELRAYLMTNTYLKWGDPWFWQKLRYALPHFPRKLASKASSSALDMNLKDLGNGNVHCKTFELEKSSKHIFVEEPTAKVT